MNDKDKKLDFDLGFLDEESPKPKKIARVSHVENKPSVIDLSKWNWKAISIVGGAILVVIWIASFGDNTPVSNHTLPSTNQVRNTSAGDDSVIIGEYRCSKYHHDKVEALSPGESERQIDSAISSIEDRANELERLERDIQYSSVSEYSSQYQIDAYNAKVNTYNTKLATYQRNTSALDSRIERFNSQIEAHNRYLIQNCTPR